MAPPPVEEAGSPRQAAQPAPPPESDWVAAAVEEAVEWEVMPGTTGEPDPERAAQLAAFFRAHPEYRDPARRAALADPACAMGTERAHERLVEGSPRAPLEVELPAADAAVVVVHADRWCTSDDWTWITAAVDEALKAQGVAVAWADAGADAAVLRWQGAERARHPLRGQGFLALRAGREPCEVGYDLAEPVLAGLSACLGVPLGPEAP